MKFFETGKVGVMGSTVAVIQKRRSGSPVYEYIFEGDLDTGQEMARQMNEAKDAGSLESWLQENNGKFERYSI